MINRRVTTQFQFSKELIEEQKHIMGAEELSSILNKQLIERFVNEMLSTRLQDLKTEEVIGSDGKSNLQIKMELFIFNKEELNGLVTMIKNGIEII
jgi:hypothetical protein